MTLGLAPRQADLFHTTAAYCVERVAADSIYGILHRECFALFPDEMFADLFDEVGRRSVPPMIVAVVMVLPRLEGLSDREAADRFTYEVRWKYAAGGLAFDYPGFVHTVLAGMRAWLARSACPDRIFGLTLEVGKQAGLVGRRRVLDSAPLYDAVATMDTVTLVLSAIRGLLAAAGDLEAGLRGLLARDDDYVAAGKPACGYDDRAAREALAGRAGQGRARFAGRPRRQEAVSPAYPGCGAAGQRDRPGPRRGHRRGVPDCPAGRQGQGYLHRRPRGPARAQDLGPRLRRLQGPRRDRPGRRADHRHRGHRPQRRGRRRSGRSARRRTARQPGRARLRAGPCHKRTGHRCSCCCR